MNRRWWRRWRILINEMASKSDKELLNQLYLYHLALVSNSGLTEESFKSTQESARNNFDEFSAQTRPWLGRTSQERGKLEHEQMKENWERHFGWSLDDEEAYDDWKTSMNELVERGASHKTDEQRAQEEEEKRIEDTKERIRERRARARRSNS